ncbi:coiled-coil domain-containing protein 78 isoform X2 [Silurus asotus]|nr:coiled-coil domain-containing protein 78 isoform X2 [Silurus asotus]
MAEEKRESSSEELKEKIRFLTEENVHLSNKLGSTQSRAAQHAASNQDLSSRLVQSEQEKLKFSKDLVEVQIEANRLREKYEAEIFELQNKVLCQEGVVSNLEAELERFKREAESSSSRLQIAEGNERDLVEEYAVLKSNFLTVSEGLEREITHSQELGDELLMLAHTHDTLLHEKEREHTNTLELERVRALLNKVSHSRIRSLLVSQHQLKEVEAENSKLQNQLKELNQEYRARLTHYIHDIKECVCRDGEDSMQLKEYVDSMLKEVRLSYRSREEQLTSTLRTYRKRLHNLNNTHQLLLTAYRVQREQILAHPEHALEAGPPEAHFNPAEVELRGETERELQKLREDKSRLETQLKIAQEQVSLMSQSSQNVALTEEAWADIRKQLRETAVTAQEMHERERLQLITRATVAEEQVRELQEYVDNHLGRYKLEITRLRRMLQSDAGRSQSAEASKPRPLRQSLNNTSYEV